MARGGGARAWQFLKRNPGYGTAWRVRPGGEVRGCAVPLWRQCEAGRGADSQQTFRLVLALHLRPEMMSTHEMSRHENRSSVFCPGSILGSSRVVDRRAFSRQATGEPNLEIGPDRPDLPADIAGLGLPCTHK